MVGGKISGSNAGPTTEFIDLATITKTPTENAWNELAIPNTKIYRYIKYTSPADGYTNVAEIEFYNDSAKLIGTGFGTAGSRDNSGNTFEKALDGNVDTFFDNATSDNGYVGIDLGADKQVAKPEILPASGTFTSPQSVTIKTNTTGAKIYFILDNSTPSLTHGTLYTAPISVSAKTTIIAIGFKDGMSDSLPAVSTLTFGGATTGNVIKSLKTYHIGNSLTDVQVDWLKPVADSAGKNHTFVRSTIPGATIKWNWEHDGISFGDPSYRTVFNTKSPFNYLVLQPFADPSLTTDADFAGRFLKLAQEKSPNIQLWIYAQWPLFREFPKDALVSGANWSNPVWTPPSKANTWEEAIQNMLAYHELVRQKIADQNPNTKVFIIPAGTAFANLKKEIDAGKVPGASGANFAREHFQADEGHLIDKGAYMINLVFYSCFYKESPEGKVTYSRGSVTAEQAKIYQRIAWETAKNYKWSGITP